MLATKSSELPFESSSKIRCSSCLFSVPPIFFTSTGVGTDITLRESRAEFLQPQSWLHEVFLLCRVGQVSISARSKPSQGENVDFVNKFEKALRKRHHSLMTEIAKIEHLIDAFEKGAKRGAKRMGRGRISPAGRKRISIAQKRRWAAKKK